MVGVLFDQKHGQLVALVERANGGEDLLHEERRQAERRLVQKNEPRPAHQRAADRQHLLLATRQCAAALGAAVGEPREQRENALEVGHEMSLVGHRRADLQVFEHGHARKNPAAFGRLRDAELGDLVRRQRSDIAAGEADAAVVRARIAEYRHHQGRLAGAVGADQRDDLAFMHIEVDALERKHVAVRGLDAAQREEGRRHGLASVCASASSSSATPR